MKPTNQLKTFLARTMAVLVLTTFVSTTARADDSGTYGDGVTYTYVESTKTLTISKTGDGYGDMYEFAEAPWYNYREDILTVVIEDGVTSIGKNAFQYCEYLSSVTIPFSVTSIGSKAFKWCSSLKLVNVLRYDDSADPKITTLGKDVFSETHKDLVILVPSDALDTYKAAENWSTYQSKIVLGGYCGDPNVNNGNDVIWYLTDDNKTLTITGTGAMGDYTNAGSLSTYQTNIQTVVIEEGVTSIMQSAFGGFNSLSSVTIPSSVTSIGDAAFIYCTSLSSLTIPSSVTSIGEGVFYDCHSLSSIIVDKDNPNYKSEDGILFSKDGTTLICHPALKGDTSYTIPSSVTSISKSAFDTCSSLSSVTSPSSVTRIGEEAFKYCTSLSSVTIPSSVTSIGDGAFSNCDHLKEVYVLRYDGNANPQITTLGNDAFRDTHSDLKIMVPSDALDIYKGATNWISYAGKITTFDGYCGKKDENDGKNVIWYLTDEDNDGTKETLTIAGTGDMADYDSSDQPWNAEKTNIKTVVIESGVTSIGKNAFCMLNINTSLSSVTIPASVTSIGENAFQECTSLSSVTIPEGVTNIGIYAFWYCTSLSSINIPSSVTTIGNQVFVDCNSLSAINVDTDNAKYKSEDGVLFNKEGTTLICYPGGKSGDYTIPSSVTSIYSNAFFRCTSLLSVTIPEGVTKIDACAFQECKSLSSVTIPASVTSIGNSGFDTCSNLKEVFVLRDNTNGITTLGSSVFYGTPNAVIWVPSTALETYKNADNWSYYYDAGKIKSFVPSVAVTGIDAPVTLTALDGDAVCTTTGVDATKTSVAWKNGSTAVTGKAQADIAYTVEVTLTAADNYTFTSSTTATINSETVTPTLNTDGTLTLAYTFPKTTDQRYVVDNDGTAVTTMAYLAELALEDKMQAYVAAGKLKATVTPANKYWSLSCGVDILVPEGVTVYKARLNSTGTKVELTEIDKETLGGVLKANNGVVVSGTAGKTYDLVVSPNNGITQISTIDMKSYGEDNQLEPVIVETHFNAEDYYVLKDNKFHVIDATKDTKIPAGKAVLRKPANVSASRSMDIEDSGETTGISGPSTGSGTAVVETAETYDLNGQRIEKPVRRGVYIRNGQKVIIK